MRIKDFQRLHFSKLTLIATSQNSESEIWLHALIHITKCYIPVNFRVDRVWNEVVRKVEACNIKRGNQGKVESSDPDPKIPCPNSFEGQN